MKKFKRYLKMDLPKGQSAFLWGARKTGKSFYLKEHFHDSVWYDLLNTNEYWRLMREPDLLRKEVLALPKKDLAKPIIIDEVQRIPLLLNEVHWLIENANASFILCGSSARKLRKEGANLLGGRAWRYSFYPLTFAEIPEAEFDLLKALNQGLIPTHYLTQHWKKTINAYIQDYLTEEVKAEGLVRNLVAFAEFLELAAFSNGEVINFASIARDCGVDSKTVKEYYQILVDTLLGYFVTPYHSRKKREHVVVTTPKFYLFDVGVVNGLIKRQISQLKGIEAGRALEQYILMELMAYRGLNDLDYPIQYWRTRSGSEVDFVLNGGEIAVEVKISSNVHKADCKGLAAFHQYAKPKKSYLVCNVDRSRKVEIEGCEINIMSWKSFIKALWKKEIIAE